MHCEPQIFRARAYARRSTSVTGFKWLLKAASARTVEDLWAACGDVLDCFAEAECRICFQHCDCHYT